MPAPFVPERKLGKLPYRADPRNVHLAQYLTAASAVSSDWEARVTVPWGMYENDQIGDCAVASPCHMEIAWSANAASVVFEPTDPDCVAAYEAISGFNPASPVDPATGENPTDVGCVISDVLAYWKSTGIAGQTIGDYVEVNPQNFAELSTAINVFGGVDLGFQLPLAAQNMSNGVWSGPPLVKPKPVPWWQQIFGVKPAATGDYLGGQWAPGSWGGHSVCAVGADASTKIVTIITWGQVYRVTWSFMKPYCSEAWAILSPEWLKANGDTPSGLNLAQLQADLAAL